MRSWICSPATVVKNLIKLKDMPADKFGGSRIVNLPGITVTIQEILDAVEQVGGKEAVAFVKEEIDHPTERLVKSWPPRFDVSRRMRWGRSRTGNWFRLYRLSMTECMRKPLWHTSFGNGMRK